MKRIIAQSAVALGIVLALSACTDPYDPGQRALGGGLIGAGTGAAIGGLAGGGQGAVAGALIGGAVGAVGGAVTTPQPPPPGYYQQPGYRGYPKPGSTNSPMLLRWTRLYTSPSGVQPVAHDRTSVNLEAN